MATSTGALVRPGALLSPLVSSVVLLAVVIAVAAGARLPAGVVLGLVLGLLSIGSLVTAGYLATRSQRPVAAVGVLVTAVSLLVAFSVSPQPWLLWTVLFFAGALLVVYGARPDTPRSAAWPLTLLRIVLGWSWVDNAQDHFWNGQWFAAGGGGFAQVATGAANRAPTFFLDGLYGGFLKGVVVANPDTWAGLAACGELAIGVMLALGVATPVAAFLSVWQSSNYILMKGTFAHGAYTDKVYAAAALTLMLMAAGQVYGVDAALRRTAPAWVARWLLGTSPGGELEAGTEAGAARRGQAPAERLRAG